MWKSWGHRFFKDLAPDRFFFSERELGFVNHHHIFWRQRGCLPTIFGTLCHSQISVHTTLIWNFDLIFLVLSRTGHQSFTVTRTRPSQRAIQRAKPVWTSRKARFASVSNGGKLVSKSRHCNLCPRHRDYHHVIAIITTSLQLSPRHCNYHHVIAIITTSLLLSPRQCKYHHVTAVITTSLQLSPSHCNYHHVTAIITTSLKLSPRHCSYHYVTAVITTSLQLSLRHCNYPRIILMIIMISST